MNHGAEQNILLFLPKDQFAIVPADAFHGDNSSPPCRVLLRIRDLLFRKIGTEDDVFPRGAQLFQEGTQNRSFVQMLSTGTPTRSCERSLRLVAAELSPHV